MIKFSFLISMYNGEKFLDRLFSSLLTQDIPVDEYEIVCVDDCSKDHSVDVVERYQKQYPCFRLIKNKVNSRVAKNVNTLIDSALGKYMWFLGQDDYIEENCLGRLYNQLEKEGLDVLFFNYRRVFEDESIQSECRVATASATMTGVEWIKEQFAKRDYCDYLLGYEWRAVYRTDLWREKKIRCIDGMNYEDTIIMLKAIVYAKAIASIDDILYNYRINSNSITYCENFVKRGDLIYEYAFQVGKEVEDFYKELKEIDATLASNLYAHLLVRYNNFTFDLIRTPNEHKHAFYQCLKQHLDYVNSKRNYLNLKARILTNKVFGYPIACLCYYGYKTYKRCKR